LVLLLGLPALVVSLAAYPLPGYSAPGEKENLLPKKGEIRSAPTDLLGDLLPDGALARVGTLRFRCPFELFQLTFSPDGKILAVAGGDGLHLWEFPSGKERFHITAAGGAPNDPTRHMVTAVAFSPDGKTMAVGAPDASMRLWDVADGKELRKLGKLPNPVVSFAFSADGKTLAASSEVGDSGTVAVWDVATGKSRAEFKEPFGSLGDLAFWDEGKTLAIHTTNDLVFREVPSGKELKRYKVGKGQLVYSADRRYAAFGSFRRHFLQDSVRLYDLKTGERLPAPKGHAGGVGALALSPDGKALVSADSENTIRLWDVATRKELHRLTSQGPWEPSPIIFSPDGKRIVAGHRDGFLDIWDVATGKLLAPAERHRPCPLALAFSPGGATLATVDVGTVRFWDAKGALLKQFTWAEPPQPARPRPTWPWRRPGTESVEAELNLQLLALRRQHVVSFAPDGKTFVLEDHDRLELSFRDAATGKERFKLKGREVVYSPDGKTFALVDFRAQGEAWGEELWLYGAASGKEIRQLKGPAGRILTMAFSPSGKTLTAGVLDQRDCSSVWSWDVASGKATALLRGLPLAETDLRDPKPRGDKRTAPVQGAPSQAAPIAFSSNGRTMAAGGGTGHIHFWDLHRGRELYKVPGDRGTSRFSPDGRTVAVGTNAAIHLYEVATGQERCRFAGPNHPISALAFSHDGRQLAVGSQDTTVLVWDVTGRVQDGKLREAALTPAELDHLWNDLGGDAARAHRAIWTLVAAPNQAVPFLTKRLRPVELDAKQLAQWIADLGHEKFQVRAKALAEIERLGAPAEKAVRQELTRKPPLEVRRRLEQLLARLEKQVTVKSWLPTLRALEVLEQIGSAEARGVLETMAKGTPNAEPTQDAQAALARLNH
jgi:WD40 repeat protein